MWSNCLIFSIKDYISNGGSFYLELWPHKKYKWWYGPHFSTQRGRVVYDFGNGDSKAIGSYMCLILFNGDERVYPDKVYKQFQKKYKFIRIKLFNRKYTKMIIKNKNIT